MPQVGEGAVYPGLMELKPARIRVQCMGRGCDEGQEKIPLNSAFFTTLPLFGRDSVVVVLQLLQVALMFLNASAYKYFSIGKHRTYGILNGVLV